MTSVNLDRNLMNVHSTELPKSKPKKESNSGGSQRISQTVFFLLTLSAATAEVDCDNWKKRFIELREIRDKEKENLDKKLRPNLDSIEERLKENFKEDKTWFGYKRIENRMAGQCKVNGYSQVYDERASLKRQLHKAQDLEIQATHRYSEYGKHILARKNCHHSYS